MTLAIEQLTPEAFAPFGDILTHAEDAFQPLLHQPDAPGWQLAVNNVVAREVTAIHRHTNTREAFMPMSGMPILIAAPADQPDRMRAFLLDRPVCMHIGIWHVIITLTDKSVINICESAVVESEDHPLPEPLRPCLAPAG